MSNVARHTNSSSSFERGLTTNCHLFVVRRRVVSLKVFCVSIVIKLLLKVIIEDTMNVNEGEHVVGDIDRGSRKRRRNIMAKKRKSKVR
jgi:hypothetical protein